MNKDNELKKLIKKDCRKAMFSTVVVYTVGDLLGALLTVYTADVLGHFADAVLNLDFQNGMSNFWVLLLCLLVDVFAVPLINMGGESVMLANALHHDRICMDRFLNKTYGNAMSIDAGEAQSRLEDDPIALRCNWVSIVEYSILIPITMAYLLHNSLQVSFIYTIVVLVVLMLKLIVPVAVKKTQAKFDVQNREYRTTVRSYETEITEKPHIVIIYGLKNAMIERLNTLYQIYYDKVVRKSSRYETFSKSILSFLDTFCVLVILFVGALLVSQGSITAGAVAAMVGYFAIYNTMIDNIGNIIKTLPIFQNDVSRMMVLYSDGEREYGENIDDISMIEAKDLAFSYGNEAVLDGLTFCVKKGDKVAVIGKNGSGKSTLIQILCGLFDNYEGNIRVSGKELKELAPETWRDQFAFVQQDPYLFEGSVAENIGIGNLAAKQEDIIEVMERLGIKYLIDRQVSFNEKGLSGGEKQRISIARALLKKSDLLIFDEPSNNLDIGTVEWISSFIKECRETVIFITHDEALIEKADKTICL